MQGKTKTQAPVVPKPEEKEKKDRSKPSIASDESIVMWQGKMYTVAQLKTIAEQTSPKKIAGGSEERKKAFTLEVMVRIFGRGGNISPKDLIGVIKTVKDEAKKGMEDDATLEQKAFLKKVGRLGTTPSRLYNDKLITRVKIPNAKYFWSITNTGLEMIGKTPEKGTVEAVASEQAEAIIKDL